MTGPLARQSVFRGATMVDRHHPGKAPTALLTRLSDGACRTIEQLADDLDLTRRQVSDAAAKLLRRGYLDRMAVGCYQLTEAGQAAAVAGEVITSKPRGPSGKVNRKRNTLRQRAWTAMGVRRSFTVQDLICDAATPDDGNPTENIQRYVRSLAAAGYVKETPRRARGTAPSSNGFKVWVLVRNTGRAAPVVSTRRPVLHDFNTGEDVPCAPR